MEISANLYENEIKYTIHKQYCLLDYVVLANILSAMQCSTFSESPQRGYSGPWGKKGKCRLPASEANRQICNYAT